MLQKNSLLLSSPSEVLLPRVELTRGSFSLCVPEQRLSKGRVVGVFGKSGSGKSTYLSELSSRLGQDKCIILGQDDDGFGEISVAQNLELGLLMGGHDQSNNLVDRVVSVLSLGDLQRRKVNSLSGGQRRRVALARTLLADTPVVMLDEPFNGLGHFFENRAILLIDERRRRGHSAVVVSHDFPLLSSFSDSILLLEDGECLGNVDPQQPDWTPASAGEGRAVGMENIIPTEEFNKYFEGIGRSADIIERPGVMAFWKEWATIYCEQPSNSLPTFRIKKFSSLQARVFTARGGRFAAIMIDGEAEALHIVAACGVSGEFPTSGNSIFVNLARHLSW
jgi:ABC-type lipoprotein export system ATPase subunit